MSASILTLIEELRGEIRELRDRVAILEISTGESSDPSEVFLNPPAAPAAVPAPVTTTTTTTTTRPVSHITWKLFTVGVFLLTLELTTGDH